MFPFSSFSLPFPSPFFGLRREKYEMAVKEPLIRMPTRKPRTNQWPGLLTIDGLVLRPPRTANGQNSRTRRKLF
jgi:hypothetical protein